MSGYAASNLLGGTQQSIGTSFKTLLAIMASSGTSLQRGKIVEFTFGTDGTPADQAMTFDVSRISADGTATSVTPNKLDPAAGAASETRDAHGTSWLADGVHRSPTGNLYMCPAESPETSAHGDWISYGTLEIGAVATSGDDGNALWDRYVDWDSGLILGLLDYTWERPDDGTYANVRASRISDDDEYYQAVFGRAGSYKIQAFLREMPNVLSNNARPI